MYHVGRAWVDLLILTTVTRFNVRRGLYLIRIIGQSRYQRCMKHFLLQKLLLPNTQLSRNENQIASHTRREPTALRNL